MVELSPKQSANKQSHLLRWPSEDKDKASTKVLYFVFISH
jgi:hypothetical protein